MRRAIKAAVIAVAVAAAAAATAGISQLSLNMAPGGTVTAAGQQRLDRAVVTGATFEIDGTTYVASPVQPAAYVRPARQVPSWLSVRPVPPSVRTAGRFGPRCVQVVAGGHLATTPIVCPDGRVEINGM